jgi:hypothetical protein
MGAIFKKPLLGSPSKPPKGRTCMNPMALEGGARMTIEPEQLARARRCRARTRSGAVCRSPAVRGRTKCWRHAVRGSGALCGPRNGNYRHGRYTREAKAVSKWAREMARDAEVFLATTLNRLGKKPPKVYRRRRHVVLALAASKAKAKGVDK